MSGAELAARGLASTVVLRCEASVGSGFFVAQDRVLTNAHVLCASGEALRIRTSDGREGTGTPIQVNQELDLALLQTGGLQGDPLPLGDAGSLRVGDPVVVVGTPKGMEFSVSQGVISNADRTILGVAYLQTDAAVNPGNSGGPTIDAQGRVVGVVSLKRSDAEGIGLVLPINYAFTGGQAMLSSPLPRGSAGFQRMVAVAEAAERDEASALALAGQRPGLVAAQDTGTGHVVATILWPRALDPGQQRFKFALWDRGRRLCSMEAEASVWSKVEGKGGRSVLPPRVKLWLERHGFASDIYAANTTVDMSQCLRNEVTADSELEIELEGADADASRIRL